ncbi:hypothetical protein FHS79_003746, partial [Polymorphobacter multimanifer]|nr:hypothetical protein [Polymorphobacter multimanifer]
MLSILANRTYRHLLLAQIVALVGTGLATVALGLLAYELAGGNAGAVLGTALAIKMLAYIGIGPIVGACQRRSDSRPVWRCKSRPFSVRPGCLQKGPRS